MWIRSLRNTVAQFGYDNGCFSRIKVPSLLLTKVSSISLSTYVGAVNSSQIQNPSASVIYYLINSVGLSENEAISVSKKVHFETTSKPDSVVSLLETYGFTKSYISKLITKRPSILSSEPEIAIKTKFDFFKTKGLSGIDLAKFVLSDPRILGESLPTQIVPVFDILRNIVHSDAHVFTILRRHPWILSDKQNIRKMTINIELLRDEGVPQSNIIKFLINQPRALTITTTRFKETIEEIKGMGFDHLKYTFLRATEGLIGMSKSTWEKKVNAYKKWGWSEDEIHNAFMYSPQCMITSEEKITSTMDYLVNQMGWSSFVIAKFPVVFTFSLEKRIIPRCSVYSILTSKGLVSKQIPLSSLFKITDESFLEKFVIKFEAEAPELLKLYPSAVKSKAI